MDDDKKKIILEFIKKNKVGVVSTVGPEGNPHSSVVEFGETDELELIFDTFSTYRKYTNIKNDSRISFVIGWDDDITVQYEGEAFELETNETEKYKNFYYKKNPEAQRWEKEKSIKFFKVIPKWIRYSDLNEKPWKVFEVKFE